MSKSLAAGVGLVSAANMLGGILNLLLIVALTRLLSKPDFAAIAFIYMLFTLMSSIGTLGLPSALLFYVPKLSPSASRHLGLWLGGLLTALSLPMTALFMFFGPILTSKFALPNAYTLFSVVGLALIFDFSGQTLTGYLLAKERYLSTAIVTTLFNLSRFLGLTLPAYFGLGLVGMVWGLCLTTALRSLGFFIYTGLIESGELNEHTRAEWQTKELFSYGIPLSLSSVVGKLNVQADKYMIAALATAEVYAIYHVGALEVPLVATLAYSVTRALMPSLVSAHDRRDHHGFIELWHTSMIKVSIIILPVFSFLMFFAEPLITLIFSADYQQASIPFRIYLCLLPLRLCAYGAILRSMGATKPVLMSSLLSLIINVSLNYPLYLWLGLSGPATASVIAQLIAILFLLNTIRGHFTLPWRAVFPFSKILTGLCISLIAALLTFLIMTSGQRYLSASLSSSSLHSALTLNIAGAIYLVLYLPLAWRVRYISTQDLKTLWSWLSLKSTRKALRARLSK